MSNHSLYTAEIANKILAELLTGRSLRDICRGEGMPAERTVQGWVGDDCEGFAARYAQARQIGRPRTGRLTLYTPELADRILHELQSGRTLRDVCLDDDMPNYSTVGRG